MAKKGYKQTEEHKKKIADAQRGLKRNPLSDETKLKISIGNKGKKVSEETKKKLSLVNLGNQHCKGRIGNNGNGWKKGHHKLGDNKGSTGKHWEQTPEQSKNKTGDRNPSWKGGKSSKYRAKNAPRPKPDNCEICGTLGKDLKKGLCYDHDHITGKFRGWLCSRCNVALGMVNDNTETLLALVEYIKKSRS